MIDVQQVALALRACTRRSLVIIDEFGKGTESNGKFLPGSTDVRWCRIILCCTGTFSQTTIQATKSVNGSDIPGN